VATLRLFGPARLAAGQSVVDVEGATVGQVLASAEDRFGEDLARVVATSRIWVNGTAATVGDPVRDGDEVSVIPPVSGG
jgi:molybdopterin synthase sulfur carrier subunit